MSKMKRMMGILLACVMVLGLMPGMSLTAHAETAVTEYELWVGGVQVKSANASDVLGDDGSVSFVPGTDTNTLILTGILGVSTLTAVRRRK